jgi:hypothetical protein
LAIFGFLTPHSEVVVGVKRGRIIRRFWPQSTIFSALKKYLKQGLSSYLECLAFALKLLTSQRSFLPCVLSVERVLSMAEAYGHRAGAFFGQCKFRVLRAASVWMQFTVL